MRQKSETWESIHQARLLMNMAAIENGHLEDLVRRLGKENVITDEPSLKTAAANTLGLERHLRGILYPRSTEQVQQIVLIANKHGLKLHPISSGMNIGYGICCR